MEDAPSVVMAEPMMEPDLSEALENASQPSKSHEKLRETLQKLSKAIKIREKHEKIAENLRFLR